MKKVITAGQRVNVKPVLTESWQSDNRLYNAIVNSIDSNYVSVYCDDLSTWDGKLFYYNSLASGGKLSLSSYIIESIN